MFNRAHRLTFLSELHAYLSRYKEKRVHVPVTKTPNFLPPFCASFISHQFIQEKDRSVTYIDMRVNTCRNSLKYTCISNTKHIYCLYATQPTKQKIPCNLLNLLSDVKSMLFGSDRVPCLYDSVVGTIRSYVCFAG